jgi:hypothetical protein
MAATGLRKAIFEAQRNLRVGNSPLSVVSRAKYKLSFDELDPFINAIEGSIQKEDHKLLYGLPYPTTIKEAHAGPLLFFEDSLGKELNWTTQAVLREKERINLSLRSLSSSYDMILLGSYDEAEVLLDTAKSDYGYSIAWLARKFLLKSLKGGLKSNKEWLSDLNNESPNIYISTVCDLLSRRSEANRSTASFQKELDIVKENLKEPKHNDFLQYLFSHFILRPGPTEYDIGNILFYSDGAPIIDRYLKLKKACQEVIATNSPSVSKVVKTLRRLSKHIDDPQLLTLLIYADESTNWMMDKVSEQFAECVDRYTCGRYQESLQLAVGILKNAPQEYAVYNILVRSAIHLQVPLPKISDTSLADQFLSAISTHYKGESKESPFGTLPKLASIILGEELSFGMLGLYYKTTDHNLYKHAELMSHLTSSLRNPAFSKVLRSLPRAIRYLDRLEKLTPFNETAEFFRSYMSGFSAGSVMQTTIPEDRKLRYEGRSLSERGDDPGACDVFSNLLKNSERKYKLTLYDYNEVLDDLIECLVRLSRIDEALAYAVDYSLKFPNVPQGITRLRSLRRVLKSGSLCDFGSILIPILYSLCGSEKEDIWIAHANFLTSNDVDRPSRLLERVQVYDRQRLYYYLSQVCVLEIIDSSYVFRTTEELEGERIALCRWLAENDRVNSERYTTEVLRITEKAALRKGLTQIDKSKIYVNIQGIRSTYDASFREAFAYYNEFGELLKHDAYLLLDGEQTYNIRLITKSSSGELMAKTVVFSRTTPATLFHRIFSDVRDKFLFSQYGLDANLSVRIRHGILVKQIRRPFEKAKLISFREEKSDGYAKNSYWESKLKGATAQEQLVVQDALKSFSGSVDAIAAKVRDEWVQISTESSARPGLFTFYYDQDSSSRLFYEKFEDIRDYDSFLDQAFFVLVEQISVCLENIRQKITNDLRSELASAIDFLDSKIRIALSYSNGKNELQNAIIGARSEVGNELTTLSSWFQPPASELIVEFDFDLALNTALAMIENLNPGIGLQPTISQLVTDKFSGKYFSSFVYLLFVLLDNIVRHSGAPNEKVPFSLTASDNEGLLDITTTNVVSTSKLATDPVRKLNEKKAVMSDSRLLDIVKQEGGTGLLKVSNIIASEFQSENKSFEFSLAKDTLTIRFKFQTINIKS